MQRNSQLSISLRQVYGLFFFVLLALSSASAFAILKSSKEYSQIQWVDLIPQSDLKALLNPPSSLSQIEEGSEFDSLPTDPLANSVEQAIGQSAQGLEQKPMSPQEQAYYAALESTNIKADMNKKNIRIAGFIVPLEYDENQKITEFFLVPYFGACIHVPPPPPNQIIYVKYSKGLTLDAIYDPFWIEGQLITEIIENELALSAYTLNASDIHTYDKFKS